MPSRVLICTCGPADRREGGEGRVVGSRAGGPHHCDAAREVRLGAPANTWPACTPRACCRARSKLACRRPARLHPRQVLAPPHLSEISYCTCKLASACCAPSESWGNFRPASANELCTCLRVGCTTHVERVLTCAQCMRACTAAQERSTGACGCCEGWRLPHMGHWLMK